MGQVRGGFNGGALLATNCMTFSNVSAAALWAWASRIVASRRYKTGVIYGLSGPFRR